jgi:hypothetical protein
VRTAWDALPDPPGLEWWWAVSHLGHPAFYLRALMPGDFAPGRAPLPRHVRPLRGPSWPPPASVTCGTCGQEPDGADLDVLERATGARGFLAQFRAGRRPWPPATTAACWECGGRDRPAPRSLDGVPVCETCHAALTRAARR